MSDVRFLLQQGVNPSLATIYGWASLHWAAANGHVECVRLLLQLGAEVSPRSDTSKTPLDLAIEKRQTEVEKILRDDGGETGNEVFEKLGGIRYSYGEY